MNSLVDAVPIGYSVLALKKRTLSEMRLGLYTMVSKLNIPYRVVFPLHRILCWLHFAPDKC